MTEEGNHNEAYQLDSGCSSLASSEFESKYGSLNRCGQFISKGLEDSTSPDEKETGREVWNSQIEFILCSVSYAVGLGNIWRFPYLVYKNGGGSFLIPYFVSLLFIGLPMFFLEMVLGQFSGKGATIIFRRICPIFSGLGWAMLCATIIVSLYYNVIVAWTLFYIFKGFASELPWTTCTEKSSYHCYDNFTNQTTNDSFEVVPAEDFFLYQMLGIDKAVNTWNNYGHLQWKMVLCLLGAWTILCLCLIKGIHSVGKVLLSSN